MKLQFTKMHGCCNDYIYFDCIRPDTNGKIRLPKDPSALAQAISPRRSGVGGDGIVLIGPSDRADAFMRMFNADGSEGRMCGNAIRCVAKYLSDHGITAGDTVRVETLSGIKTLRLEKENGLVTRVTVDMGPAGLNPREIPVALPLPKIIRHPIEVDHAVWHMTCVSMGSPHCVVFTEHPETLELEHLGPLFEQHPLFPQRINTEFVHVEDRNQLAMRVWERGSGETWACGTGACAAAVAAVENGFSDSDTPVTVHMRGGDLVIRYTPSAVWMTGPACEVFTGAVEGEDGGVWPAANRLWNGDEIL